MIIKTMLQSSSHIKYKPHHLLKRIDIITTTNVKFKMIFKPKR
jgi:hypothetical protein